MRFWKAAAPEKLEARLDACRYRRASGPDILYLDYGGVNKIWGSARKGTGHVSRSQQKLARGGRAQEHSCLWLRLTNVRTNDDNDMIQLQPRPLHGPWVAVYEVS